VADYGGGEGQGPGRATSMQVGLARSELDLRGRGLAAVLAVAWMIAGAALMAVGFRCEDRGPRPSSGHLDSRTECPERGWREPGEG